MNRITVSLFAALAIGAGSLKADDDASNELDELRSKARETNSQLEDEASRLRWKAIFEDDFDRSQELRRAADRIEDSQIDLY